MEPKGAEFARVAGPFPIGENNEEHFILMVNGYLVNSAPGEENRKLFQDKADHINAAVDARVKSAVEEAVRKTRAEYICQEHGKILLRCLSCEEEAESRVWEAAAKIAEATPCLRQDGTPSMTVGYEIASALRSKAASS